MAGRAKSPVASRDRGPSRNDLRARMIDVAQVMFRTRGFEATSVDAIGAELGVSGPALYHHFSSKRALLFECLHAPMVELIEVSRAATFGKSPADQLVAFVETHVLVNFEQFVLAFELGNAVVGMGFLARSLDEKDRQKLLGLVDDHVHDLKQIIIDGTRKKVFAKVNPTVATFAIIGMAEHLAWVRPDGPLTVEQVAQMYGQLALNTVLRR